MKIFIISNFVAWMLPREETLVRYRPLSLDKAKEIAGSEETESAVRHEEIAAAFQLQLGVPIAENRIQVVLGEEVGFLWGQYSGPTLSEKAKELPRNSRIEWWLLTVANE